MGVIDIVRFERIWEATAARCANERWLGGGRQTMVGDVKDGLIDGLITFEAEQFCSWAWFDLRQVQTKALSVEADDVVDNGHDEIAATTPDDCCPSITCVGANWDGTFVDEIGLERRTRCFSLEESICVDFSLQVERAEKIKC